MRPGLALLPLWIGWAISWLAARAGAIVVIYTGILLAVVATMIAKGTVLGVVGAMMITAGVWLKARFEESWLRSELGPDAYDGCRRRVPTLIPFGPKGK